MEGIPGCQCLMSEECAVFGHIIMCCFGCHYDYKPSSDFRPIN